MMMPVAQNKDDFSFGPFCLIASERLLTKNGVPVDLSPRAFDILAALLSRPSEVVSKSDLIGLVWPGVTIEEGTLRWHIAYLRKALSDGRDGARYIQTVSGRGYCFAATASRLSTASRPADEGSTLKKGPAFPARLSRMIGRDVVVEAISAQLMAGRFMTIVGAGGIGKTTVAVSIGRRLLADFGNLVYFVDLGSLKDPLLVASATVQALGLAVNESNPVPSLIAYLRDRRILLVFDNCEHVIEAVSALAERIYNEAPQVHILATSREALRLEGEQVHRLAPLEYPSETARLTAAEASAFPAIRLFIERATANQARFTFSDADAPVVAEICRKLDGIALAIELAAGRIDTFGIRGVAALLGDRFHLLTGGGRRTAVPRHQTLSATLDWSYETLPEAERLILRGVGIFSGRFTLEAACAVAAASESVETDVISHLASLVGKSLIVADIGGEDAYFKLLETTRGYVVRKLAQTDELERFARRHALYYRGLFEQAEVERQRQAPAEWVETYAFEIDNLRAALDWAFSPRGDVSLGIDLTLAAASLWTHLSLNLELRSRAETALTKMGSVTSENTLREMSLYAKLASALLHTAGSESKMRDAWRRVLAIAKIVGDIDYELRALWGLWIIKIKRGEFREAMELAEQFRAAASASSDIVDGLVAERILAQSHFYLGNLEATRLHIDRMLATYRAPPDRLHILRYQFDQDVVARNILGWTLWLQGFSERAIYEGNSSVDEAIKLKHPVSQAWALTNTCPILILTGDLPGATRLVDLLLEQTSSLTLTLWRPFARCVQGLLLIKQGNLVDGSNILETAIREMPENSYHLRYIYFQGELADAYCCMGETVRAMDIIEEALDQSERSGERWCVAELLRIKGTIILKSGSVGAADESDRLFLSSLDWARRQGLLGWELRTATSLTLSWKERGCPERALEILASVYARFTEGFEMTNLKGAKALLDDLS
jgi:predicted ATPase/DNA-binding winged helix-turn-helix (wHTH) protein